MKIEFFIPSKGRPECRSLKLLREQAIDAFVVVEPQDYAEYAKVIPEKQLIKLPLNDMGIVYVRNHIRLLAIKRKCDWFFTVDDDLNGFYKKTGNRTAKTTELFMPKFLKMVEKMPSAIAAVGLEYNQHAWSATKPVFNSYVEVFAGFRTSVVSGLAYDPKSAKEDRDFILQILAKGYKSVRFPDFAFGCPTIGSNKGGLYDAYRSKAFADGCHYMEKKWGKDICVAGGEKSGQPEVKINWRHFK